MKFLHFLMLLISLLATNGIAEEIEIFPKQDIYQEGDKLILTCAKSSDFICKWLRAGQIIDFDHEKRYTSNTPSNCNFTIKSVRYDDDGRWKCHIIPINDTDSEPIILRKQLTVDDRSFHTGAHLITNKPEEIQVEEYGKVELNCNFNSSAPACFWMKDNEVVAIGGRYQYSGDKYEGDCSIQIKNVNYKDDGKWQCCYPKMDNWPLVKSQYISLNITVTPIRPVITVQGIAVEESAKVYYYSATQRYTYYNPNPIFHFNDYQIFCWSENGSPTANLSWQLMDIKDRPIPEFKDSSQQTTMIVEGFRNLKTSNRRFLWQRTPTATSTPTSLSRLLKLVCNAQHPNYVNVKSTYIWIVWADTII